MKPTYVINLLVLSVATMVVGCANNPSQQYSPSYSQSYSEPTYTEPNHTNASSNGVIESIQVLRTDRQASGAGAILGGVVGGILGNQVGGGDGRTAATVIGAVGGAVVGNNVEKNKNAQQQDSYQIDVRLERGGRTSIIQNNISDLRTGDRVRVINGHVYRD